MTGRIKIPNLPQRKTLNCGAFLECYDRRYADKRQARRIKMLFLNSKEKREEKSAPVVDRAPRYESMAVVNINGYEGIAVLRNVSQSGFRMESKTFVEIEIGSIYTIRISPPPVTGIQDFDIPVEVRWAQSSPEKFSLGLMLTQGGNHFFQRYVNFIKTQTGRNPTKTEALSV
jgi:hypothetical protein